MENPASCTLGLRNVRLLQGLSAHRLEQIAARCRWRHVPAHQQVVARSGADRAVHLLVSGRVRVTTFSAAGRQVTFRDEEAGGVFGDIAAIDGQPRSADVLALDSALVASLSGEDFLRLLAEEPLVCARILQHLAQLVRSLSERVIELSTLSVRSRIHAELLRLARQAGVSGNRARLVPAPKHSELAGQVSTNREEITRELCRLTRSGLVAKDHDALVLLDVLRLEQMVDEERANA